MKRIAAALLFAVAAFAPALPGQDARPQPEDPLAKWLFPPELILKFSSEIGLEGGQRIDLASAIKEAQKAMIDLQFQLAEESLRLQRLLAAERTDEAAALAQVDRVLAAERELKRKQMQLLVRTKNMLSREQQERLRALQKMGLARPEELGILSKVTGNCC